MLRASSLGLSYPVPTISALHTCRRLYGARNRWVVSSSCPPRHASGSSSHGSGSSPLAVEAAHRIPSSLPNGHLQHPVQVQNQTSQAVQSQQGGDLPYSEEENLHVAYVQQHQRLIVMGQLEEGEESMAAHATSRVSSVVRKEEEGEGGRDRRRRVSSLEAVELESTDGVNQDVGSSKILEGDLSPPNSPVQRREKTPRERPTRPHRQVIQDPPPYAAGRPWSANPIMPAIIPGKTTHQLRNIENGLRKAHEQYRKRMEMRTSNDASGGQGVLAKLLPEAKSTAARGVSPSSSLKTDEHPIEAEDEMENTEEPLPLETTVHIREHLDVLGTTDSVDTAWGSYTYLIDTISSSPIIYNRLQHIPFAHLHRFARQLAHNRPRTHLQYLRLLSVMTYIVHVGGTLKQPEWNALIDHIGAGRRKTAAADVEKALAAFKSISAGRLPEASEFGFFDELPAQSSFAPDVYTMTILLSLAARAGNPALLKQISSAMAQSGIVPNRITHLSLLRYFTEKRDLAGLRRTLQKMRHQGMELGLDGLNACIWAYGYNNKLDIVLMIYRVLRHNKYPEDDYSGPNNILQTIATLQEEHIFVDNGIIPNEISYTALIQVMAYNGQFLPTIKIFFDMLSTENLEQGAPLRPSESGDLVPVSYSASVAVYRAVFLGFSRHGKAPSLVRDPDELDWTLKNLLEIFERFLTISENTTLTHSVLNIIISAFVQTSGGDTDVVRRAWLALDNKFGIVFHKEHSQSRLVRLKKTLFPDDQSTPRPD